MVSRNIWLTPFPKDRAERLWRTFFYPEAKARDILHLAVMESQGLKTIVTVDTHFDKFQELTRMDPKEFLDYFESQKEESSKLPSKKSFSV